MKTVYLLIPLAPLFGAIVAGLWGRTVGRAGARSSLGGRMVGSGTVFTRHPPVVRAL